MSGKPDLSASTIKHYFATRLSSLVPKKEDLQDVSAILNPFKPLREMNKRQWNLFWLGFWGWTWDAFDFFAVSLNVTNIAKSLNVSNKDITWGITLVLMLRSVGAAIFGILGDRYGRVYPFIFNLFLLIVFEIGTGFVTTYKQFLGVRAIFGIAMGGMFGNAAACSLEDSPIRARGILSGIFQEGYAFGYLLVVVFQRAITDNSEHGWRSLFWFSAGPPVIFIVWRLITPETRAFKAQMEIEQINNFHNFRTSAWTAIKKQWLIFAYLVVLMSGFNFSSHGSQDLYPTLLTAELGFGDDRSTVTNSVANLGAIAGGIFWGHMSNFLGRRLCIIICCILGGAMIYPWAFVRNTGINAGVFFLQSFVQGAWGIVPVHISELSRDSPFRSLITGLVYQLGNLCSSASSTIEATIGERFPLYKDGEVIEGAYNYSKVMAIFMGCVFGFLLIVTLLGPENKGAEFLSDDTLEKQYLARIEDDVEKADADNVSVVSDEEERVD